MEQTMTGRIALIFAGATLAAGAAAAAAKAELSGYAKPEAVVLAVKADFAPPGGAVRLTVYDSKERFLRMPLVKQQGVINEEGVAVIALSNLAAGAYSFAAYYDENGDGKLNRGTLGRPKEPFVFSNDIRPKMRKPKFDETAVNVVPGDVVVMTLTN
jgi:uncharacterized protein (DUF2141 family)